VGKAVAMIPMKKEWQNLFEMTKELFLRLCELQTDPEPRRALLIRAVHPDGTRRNGKLRRLPGSNCTFHNQATAIVVKRLIKKVPARY